MVRHRALATRDGCPENRRRIGGESAENPDAPRDRSIDAFHSSFARVRENERLTTSIRRAC